MRIGIEAQRIFRKRKHGMDIVVLELIRELQKLDTPFQFVVFAAPGPEEHLIKETANLKVVTFPGSYPVWEQIRLPAMARKYKLDLLHSTSNTAPVLGSTPLVVTIHDIIYLEQSFMNSQYTAYQRFGNLYRKWVVPIVFKKALKVVTVSGYEKENMIKAGFPEEKVEVIYNGVSEYFKADFPQEEQQRVRETYNLPAEYFLFLGNTDPKKNTPNTLKAFAKYCAQSSSEVQLVVADLDPNYAHNILKEAKLEKYFSRIHFTGYLSHSDLPIVMQQAKVFLYTSLRESFGIPMLEGMRSGVPVITGNRSALPEIAGKGALLVDVKKPEAIAEALVELDGNKDLRQTMIKAGLENAKRFSWKNMAAATLNLYQNLIANAKVHST